MAALTPTASAMHQQYVKTYNQWLKTHYPNQYGNWVNKTPMRRGAKKLGTLALLYEGLKEVFDTGSIPTDMEEREGHRAETINQFAIDTTPKIVYKDGLAVGFEAPKGSDVDMSKYMPYQATVAKPTISGDAPDTPELEWIDPMDEWWKAEETVYDEKEGPGLLTAGVRAVKSMYDTTKYYTPPPIRQKVAETAAFVTGGKYKVK